MNSPKGPKRISAGIAGMGAVTPLGNGVEDFWRAVREGKTSFSDISLFDTQSHRTSVAAQIHNPPPLETNRLGKNELSRADCFALAAARECLQDAGALDGSSGSIRAPRKTGLVVGTAAGSILGLEHFFGLRHRKEPVRDPAILLTSFCLSATATNLAAEFNISGPRLTVTTVCSSSGLALAAGMELLFGSDLTAVLVVGTETLSEVTHAGFNILRSVDPESCRPFDQSRRGLVLGEGAGAILLEKETRDGRHFHSFLSGYGLTTDLHHFTAPQPEGLGVEKTIRSALLDAGLSGGVGYINAHGTGTRLNDVAESQGIRRVLGADYAATAVSSTKSMIGHTLGAASILEAIVTIRSLEEGILPPTANLLNPDTECDLFHIAQHSQKKPISTALSNSFAFGGSNISLVFQKAAGSPGRMERIFCRKDCPVITGLGIISPLGNSLADFSAGVGDGGTGLRKLGDLFGDYRETRGGLVNDEVVRKRIVPAVRRKLNRQAVFLLAAVQEALMDAGLDPSMGDLSISYGSAFGCSRNVHHFYSQLLTEGPRCASPQAFNLSVANAPPALVAQVLKVDGQVWVFAGDETSFEVSLNWAHRLIAAGRAERVIVCAAEEMSDSVLAIHEALGMIIPGQNGGFALGEGAVAMVVESVDSARSRNADGYGRIAGLAFEQDTSCGPQDYPGDDQLLAASAVKAMQGVSAKGRTVACIGSENGLIAWDRTVAEAFHQLVAVTGLEPIRFNLKNRIGESGFAGGAGIAALLLDRAATSPILSVNGSRGGVCSSVFIERLFHE